MRAGGPIVPPWEQASVRGDAAAAGQEMETEQRMLNKQIAADLGTGEQNIKLHRAHIMRKMGVESLADLVRAAERLGIGK